MSLYAEFEGWYKKRLLQWKKSLKQLMQESKKLKLSKRIKKKVVHELLVELTTDTEVDSRIFETLLMIGPNHQL
ncbi:hypothetical protein N42HA_01111 [Lactococcus lactis]|nr:hypothetical protein [Lactococcus lactis]